MCQTYMVIQKVLYNFKKAYKLIEITKSWWFRDIFKDTNNIFYLKLKIIIYNIIYNIILIIYNIINIISYMIGIQLQKNYGNLLIFI